MHGRFVWRVDAEMKARAVDDARRNRHQQTARHQRVAGATALNTSLGPRFAAAAASRAGGTQEHLNRHDSAPLRLFTRKTDFRFERFGALARTLREECLADAGDEMSDRWKIDRDLVSKTIGIRLLSHAG